MLTNPRSVVHRCHPVLRLYKLNLALVVVEEKEPKLLGGRAPLLYARLRRSESQVDPGECLY